MKHFIQSIFHHRLLTRLLAVGMLVLGGCNGSDLKQITQVFTLDVSTSGATLNEGSTDGINVTASITRIEGFLDGVSITASGANTEDDANLLVSVTDPVLNQNASQTTINIKLGVGRVPIMAGTRSIVISASSGKFNQQETITINVNPIDAPDVYLLIGQSNMVGFGGDGEKEAGLGQFDEPLDRIQQLNVTVNSEEEVFVDGLSYVTESTIAIQPYIVRAEDPLHIPLDPGTQSKQEQYIGPGLSFAKSALSQTSNNIILVPAAWSASAFCGRSLLQANWNATPTPDPALGNTWLYDRAIARVNLALRVSGGVLRGILWHQGETDSDGNAPRCSELYQANLVNLVTQLRADIEPDARGEAGRGENSDVPFVLGTMSRGIDENNPNGDFPPEKQLVDQAHRAISALVPFAEAVILDDLTPANGYPCGNDGCIHFGTKAYREMGKRYHTTLARIAGQ